MNEKSLTLKSCSFPYVTALAAAFMALRSTFLGVELFSGDFLVVVSFFLLSFGLDLLRSGRKGRGEVLMLSSVVLHLLGEFFLTYLHPEPGIFCCFLVAAALSFPVSLVCPLLWKIGGKKGVFLLLSIFGAGIVFAAGRYFVYSYTYLYMDVIDMPLHTKVYQILVAGVALSILLEFLFRGERNYLVYSLFVVGILGAILESNLRFSMGTSLWMVVQSLLSSWIPMLFLLLLIIYIRGELPEKRIYERRNVVFSNMVYQELKPIKKKKRAPKFEIPPNVPKFKKDLEMPVVEEKEPDIR